jgi:uncharacterized paraquat-inducible protein A
MSVTDINPHSTGNASQIECLACGAARIVSGVCHGETGECPRCHYLGWTYSDELDGTTRRLIMNGGLAAPPKRRRHHHPRSYR